MKLIGPFSQALTLNHLPLKGKIRDESLEVILEAGLLVKDGYIEQVGVWQDLKAQFPHAKLEEIEPNRVLVPGLVDCHTHLCFGGNRSRDFSLRNAGKTYLEIAGEGGGIWDTVQKTRSLSVEELAAITAQHASRHLHNGVTTIEVKSGYGLSVSHELMMLRAINQADEQVAADLISTCLAAHVKPRDFAGTNTEYLEWIASELFPLIRKENLCNRIDAFVEAGAFTSSEVIPYFEKAKEYGFEFTVHADQFTPGASELAIQVGALSADHLEASTDRQIQLLAQSNTIAVALPGASIGLGVGFTPARKILDQGGALAIASDWNPGSAPMGDLLCQASILATFEKLSNAEVWAGITYRAAAALGLSDRGRLTSASKADFVAYPTTDYRDILYYQGSMKPVSVWKSGLMIK